jgi:cytochrome c-type biogenesis protein CcmH/NrfG
MSFPEVRQTTSRAILLAAGITLLGSLVIPATAGATLPSWLQHIVGASTLEAALFRSMQLPAGQALYPRPPKEAQTTLEQLIAVSPGKAELYEVRARADEQSLDEAAAESDWKLYATHATDPIAAKLELADFYQRRLLIPQEIATLNQVAASAPIASEMYLDPTQQRSWRIFERILGTIDLQNLPPSQTASTFSAFLARYPDQPAVYAAFLQFQLEQHDWPAAASLITSYRHQFPAENVFPIRAEALLEFRRGNIDAALAVYDHAFQPLWPTDLIQSYFALLDQTHRQRAFVAEARAQLAAHPDGPEALNALARIFFYDQQAGRSDSARQTLDAFRIAREARNGAWTPTDLYTLSALSATMHSYAESARYDYALASTDGTLPSGEPAAQFGLAGLISILLEAPDQPLALGSHNLTLYRDIATLDQGPGYWNGILSLWLNGTSPEAEYQSETVKAQSYFHRSKANELLAELDRRFPRAPERAALHAQLIQALAGYGEPATVIVAGKEFLSSFPSAPERLDVAGLMADAYARQNDTAAEFALYDSQLNDLAAGTGGLPLTSSATAPPPVPEPGAVDFYVRVQDPDSVDADAAAPQQLESQPLVQLPTRRSLPAGTAYARVLDRYLGRLTATRQLPHALTVLRGQLDRNPGEPLLYERLATFLQQNNMSAQQEQIFQQAIAKFQQPTYYDKLARIYLRERKREAFATLTRQVTDIFSGTDLDLFFANVKSAQPIGPQLAVDLNLYAAKRFPHDLVFTQNLLNAYQAPATRDAAAYEALLRSHWWESDDLCDQFLTYLSRTGKLQTERAQLETLNSQTSAAQVGSTSSNPAALREQAEIDIFTSHFEQAAPLLGSVADLYPTDTDTGDRAVSLFRSLAYLDPAPASTLRAVALEQNLVNAAPDSPDRLATLGDLYAEATSNGGEDLAAAAPYWHSIPELHPGSAQGFLTNSTIFWDYFQFNDALAEVTTARVRFHSPTLFGYEAGAIEENRHNLSAAVAEYTNAVIHPIEIPRHFDSALGTIAAWLKPPSDAGDSNFRSTAQSFFGSEESNARLLQLATRTASKADVDDATAKAVEDNPANVAALTLRADVLAAQHHASELTPLLTNLFNHALDRTATLDEAAAVGTLAQARNLTPVYERALAKQVALTLDQVQKIELQYSLASSLEAHKDIAGATRIIDSVHEANPLIQGVVRATTDFYARTNQPARAIATLLEAAKLATPSLTRDFTLEAVSRANDANDTAQARTLALGLLAQTPYDARVLNLIATSYARAHDDAGLKQFYLTQLDAARKAPSLTSDSRKQDIALLRRGLIPALTRLSDFAGATDQYIALLSVFPEDSSLGEEAALYALQHSRQPQLLDFLRTTVKQSPRDSRFMILLAQVETTFEDLPAAESAYSLAIDIRKDRVDLYTARADIETRLSQADPRQSELAAADFERLYVLTYHDPSWMIRVAELRARQQRPADAVKALEAAYINGHVTTATDSFTVAAQLEKWNLLADARTFAEQGVALAGPDLLTPQNVNTYPQPEAGAVTYARILARLGHADQAIATLTAARQQAEVSATSPSALAAELARENITDDEAADFRKNFATQHRQLAEQNLKAAAGALGQVVQTYYTPEQKLAFALILDKLHDASQSNANLNLAIEAATAAGLTDREADWRKQRLLSAAMSKNSEIGLYASLQQHRLMYSDLAHTLETYAARLILRSRDPILIQASQTFRDAGDIPNETRIARGLILRNNPQLRVRYFDLLLRSDPIALASLASNANVNLADAALNYAVAHASEAQALEAVSNRGRSLNTVWRPASASLVQTYFAGAQSSPVDLADFQQSLAFDSTIGERLAAPADPTKQLTGSNSFFYASRFGILLATVPKAPSLPDPEDFLPAELEQSPTSPAAYLDLARTYAEAHQIDAAVGEYNHALELSPSDAAIEDELATALYRANRHAQAVIHWGSALASLDHMQQSAMYPEAWFTSFETVTRHLGEHHMAATFRLQIEGILGPYLAKNGSYRSNELLKAVYQASATPEEGVNLILAVSTSADDPDQILTGILPASWLSPRALELILERRVALLGKATAEPGSTSSDGKLATLNSVRRQLLNLYIDHHEDSAAQAFFVSLPGSLQTDSTFADVRILLAAHAGRLDVLLASYRATPDNAPAPEIISSAANALSAQNPSDSVNARTLREFAFDRKQLDHTLIPTDFLALAESRIKTDDLAGALTLLRRLTLQPASVPANDQGEAAPNAYANTDSAAALLERNSHPAEAVPFLESLVQSVPWDASYRLRLAQAQLASNTRDKAQANLIAVARDASAPYGLRVQAARALAPLVTQPPELGSRELTLVAHPSTPADARQPYFAAARIAIAAAPSTASPDREALLREAIAIAPNGTDANRARLDLLLLQPTTANPSPVLAILRSVQRVPGAQAVAASPDNSEADAAADDTPNTPEEPVPVDSAGYVNIPLVSLPQPADLLDLPRRIRLASQIASANQRDGDLESALAYAQLAVTLARDSPQPVLTRHRDDLKTAVLLARRNALRRPDLHADLNQSIQVRPRLTASALIQEESQ